MEKYLIGALCTLVVLVIIALLFDHVVKNSAVKEEPVKDRPVATQTNMEGLWVLFDFPGSHLEWKKLPDYINATGKYYTPDYEGYTYAGTIDNSIHCTSSLPLLPKGSKIIYSNDTTLFAWDGERWLAHHSNNPRFLNLYIGHDSSYWAGTTKFRVTSILGPETEFDVRLFETAYEGSTNDVEQDFDSGLTMREHLLKQMYESLRDDLFGQFQTNLELAPTSKIIELAEEVLDEVLHSHRYVSSIRAELASRLKAMSDIEKAKELLYK